MNPAFVLAYRAFMALDRKVLTHLDPRMRTKAFEMAYRAKNVVFPGSARRDAGHDAVMATTTDLMAQTGVRRSGTQTTAPDWLKAEILRIQRDIDPALYSAGTPKASARQSIYPARREAGEAYLAMASAIARLPRRPTHFIAVPWLKRGGSDLVAIKTTEAVLRMGGFPLVITTETAESPWASLLPSGVPMIDFGATCGSLAAAHQKLVFARLLIQAAPQVLHINNSNLAWAAVKAHGKAIRQQTQIFASLYCDGVVTTEGLRRGYAHDYLLACDEHVTGYLSDNATYLSELAGLYGVDPSKLHVAYVPTAHQNTPVPAYGARKVLWAGRLDRQKRIDLLAAIAERMPDVAFDVYGEKMLQGDNKSMKKLHSLANVTLRGKFDGFGQIQCEQYGAFLYTSGWDGIPNIVLEAGVRRMSMIVSVVGGIGELIDADTGWPVHDVENIAAYCEGIRQALDQPLMAAERGARLRERITHRHTDDRFTAAHAAIAGYAPQAKAH